MRDLILLTLLSLHSVAAQSIADQVLTVTTVQHEPWLNLRHDSHSRAGNERFEGFVMDLLHHLENKTGARFEVEFNREREVSENTVDICLAGQSPV